LASRFDRNQESWKPEVGDIVEGSIVEMSTRESEYGPYPLLVILTTQDTEVAVHGFHSVLKNVLAEQRPSVGDEIAIKYCGVPEGKDYKLYKVALERRSATTAVVPDWGGMVTPEAAAEVAEATAYTPF